MLGALPKIFLRAPVTSLGRHQGGVPWDRGGLLGRRSGDLARTNISFTTAGIVFTTDENSLYYGRAGGFTTDDFFFTTDENFFTTDGPGGHLLRNLKEIGFTTDHFPLYYGPNFLYYGRKSLYYGRAGGFTTDETPLPSTSPGHTWGSQ